MKSKLSRRAAISESPWSFSRDKKRAKPSNLLTPIFDFLDSVRGSLVGPGAGAGVGCGAGLGLGVVGGFGFGGERWNQLRVVLGVGVGCGVGVGIGYGQGFGYGYSAEAFEAYLSEETSFDAKKKGKSKGLSAS